MEKNGKEHGSGRVEMSPQKRIQPGETIGVKLGVSERLTIQKLTMVESEIATTNASTAEGV
jgi:hypothetical protein